MKHALTLSIVIPVYNEENYLKACLESIAKQTVKPLEVIVVDNNSSDDSMLIAAQFPFVKILKEPRQHQVFAQTKGFDESKADILGRIDADTILPRDWVDKVIKAFDDEDIVAITGLANPYDVPLKRISLAIFRFYHTRLTKLFTGKTMLWNSNAAFRSKCWPTIKKQMLIADNIWEDYEMSFWLAKLGKVKLLPSLKVGCSFRSIHKGFFTQIAYQFRAIRVFSRHNNKLKTVVFFFAWYTMIPIFVLAVIDRNLLKLRYKSLKSQNHADQSKLG